MKTQLREKLFCNPIFEKYEIFNEFDGSRMPLPNYNLMLNKIHLAQANEVHITELSSGRCQNNKHISLL